MSGVPPLCQDCSHWRYMSNKTEKVHFLTVLNSNRGGQTVNKQMNK